MRRFNVSSPRLRLLILGFCSLLVVVAILNLSPQLAPSQPAHASLIDIWHSIFKNPPPPPPRRGISRGDDFCSVAPVTRSSSAELPKVWSDRPTLAWLGTSTAVREMAIFPKDSETPIWVWSNPAIQQPSKGTSSQLRTPHYVRVETPLSLGQIYEWRVIRPLTPEKDIIRFQTMTSKEIKSIAQGLPTADGVGDSSALKRADYFAGQRLWSDFWQEIFSVQNPSAQLNQLIAETFKAQCSGTSNSAQP